MKSFVFTLATVLLTACISAPTSFDQYQESIQSFQQATDQTAKVVTAYISDLNEFERRVELDSLRASPTRQLDMSGKLLADRFDPKAIEIRIRVFAVLKQYTSLLAALAGSDSPDRWSKAAKNLGTSAAALLGTLNQNADAVGPLTTIINLAGREWINATRSAALDTTFLGAESAIQDLSDLLKDDLQTVISQRITIVDEPLIDLAGAYDGLWCPPPKNTNPDHEKCIADGKRERQRLAVLDQIEAALAKRSQTLITLEGLEQALDGFDSAHQALVEYGQSEKGPQDLNDLIVVIDRYRAAADSVSLSFKSIKSEQ